MGVLFLKELEKILTNNFKSFEVTDNIEKKRILEFNQVSKKEGSIHFNFDEIRTKLVKDAVERMGLLPMSAEFYGSTEEDVVNTHPKSKNSHLENEFGPWFENIAKESNIWIDTNILVSRSIDSIVFGPKRSFDESSQIRIIVPRFAIFELENLAIKEKNNWRNNLTDRKEKESNKRKFTFATPGRYYMAFQNLRNWKFSRIASIANLLDIRDILYFPKNLGMLTMDALIRWEISRDPRKKRFLTRDFISALAANGEDIASIYAHRYENLTKLHGLNSTKLAELLYEIATDIGNITLEFPNESMLIEGIWGEKEWSDLWSQKKLRVTTQVKMNI